MGIVAKSQAVIRWPQGQQVPLGGFYNAYKDARDGNVVYSTRINPAPIEAWPDGEGKIGAGLGPAGEGAAGYGYGGAGAGMGGAGLGMAGFGAAMMSHVTPALLDGTWKFAIVGFDPAGNPASPSGTEDSAILAGTPEPPGIPTADSYVLGTDTLTLSWALSKDDEG